MLSPKKNSFLCVILIMQWKKSSFIISFSIALTSSSCKKDYVCVSTEKSTGAQSNGDNFRAGTLTPKAAEESCEANNEVYSNDLENCHLE